MREYEMVLLFDSDLELDIEKPLKKVEKLVSDNGGKVNKTDVWGKKRLAYLINKKEFAVYVYVEFSIEPESVASVEGVLNITKEVIRYIITNPVPEVVFPGRDEEESEDNKEEQKDAKETTTKEDKEE